MARVLWTASLLALIAAPAMSAERAVDHRHLQALQGPFRDGPSVTRACLSCHSQIGQDLLTTPHWLWRGEDTQIPGRDGVARSIGKANLVNNFCIGVQSNESSCTRCHIGFGWKDKTFNFKDPTKIDCLVCHDTTGDYARPMSADPHGAPASEPVDWTRIAQNVGPTSIQSCGSCHFNGGGGEGVKHGDLDPSLSEASLGLDLHMSKEGLGFTCSTCHRGEEIPHRITGHSASVSVRTGDVLSCSKCHGEEPHGRAYIARTQSERHAAEKFRAGRKPTNPHDDGLLNWHTRKLACQTCHIPRYAKVLPTKIWWDWSEAGRHQENGDPVQEVDDQGNITYLGIKGAFRWGKDLVPEYRWYNGQNERYLLGDRFDPKDVLVLNRPLGGPGEAGAKIWPFKVMRGRQIYDTENKYLIQPKLSGAKGSGAYWKDYDWQKAAAVGMAYANLPYSGHYGFTETVMYWPLSHMNVDGGQTLSCSECHNRQGRLKGIAGLYLPGQHRSLLIDVLGWIAVAGTFLAALAHGILRWRKRTP